MIEIAVPPHHHELTKYGLDKPLFARHIFLQAYEYIQDRCGYKPIDKQLILQIQDLLRLVLQKQADIRYLSFTHEMGNLLRSIRIDVNQSRMNIVIPEYVYIKLDEMLHNHTCYRCKGEVPGVYHDDLECNLNLVEGLMTV
jgi:hypothetical protein